MKKLLLSIILISFSLISFAQLKITNGGKVGIGITAPNDRLSVAIDTVNRVAFKSWFNTYFEMSRDHYYGTVLYPEDDSYLYLGKTNNKICIIQTRRVYSENYYTTSDSTLKENVESIDDVLEKIKKINGIRYTLKDDVFTNLPKELKKHYQRPELGFLAQEVQRVFPEVVEEDENHKLAISYSRMTPVLLEAIKEQQKEIESNTQKIQELNKRIEELEKAISGLTNQGDFKSLESSNLSQSYLYQNRPNPFSTSTSINYFIDGSVQNASIIIYDIYGKELKNYKISSIGEGSITVNASELTAGTYLYKMVCDGKVVDTKKMVLTD